MTRIILLSSLALSIAGCQPMDAVEGKPSAFQQNQERLELLTMPAPLTVANLADGIEPVVEPIAVAQPVCHEVFRINRCVGGVSVDWFYGDAP